MPFLEWDQNRMWSSKWNVQLFWNVLFLECVFGMCKNGICSFWNVLFLEFDQNWMCSSGMCLRWNVLLLECALFGTYLKRNLLLLEWTKLWNEMMQIIRRRQVSVSERLRMWAWLSTVSVIYTPCYHRQTRIENWILSTRVKTDFNEEGNYMTLNSMGWNPFCWFILIFMHFWDLCVINCMLW